ncbi:hypothetical protein [Arthrobacter sp. D2-10]
METLITEHTNAEPQKPVDTETSTPDGPVVPESEETFDEVHAGEEELAAEEPEYAEAI